jgi:drug/metabolite transporter (DMT)-like permease
LKKNNQIGALLAISSTIIWSGNFIVSRYAIHLAGPVTLALFRWIVATICLFPFGYKNLKKEWPLFVENKVYFFLMGFFGFAVYNTLIYSAGHYTTAINMSLFGSTVNPIVAALLGALVVQEKLHWKNISGILLCIIGTIYLLTNGKMSTIFNFQFGKGDLLMIAAGCCFGAYNVFVKKKPTGISNNSFLLGLFTLTSLLLLPASIIEMTYVQPVIYNTHLLWVVLYIGIGNSTISYLIWNNAIQKIGAGKASLFLTMGPILSSVEAVFFLKEHFNTTQLISGIIIILGIVINTWPSFSKPILKQA